VQLICEPGQCKMVLYYNNRTASALTNVSAVLFENPALRIQVRPDKPFDVKPQEQVLHLFIWECSRPFAEPPALKIQFTYDEAYGLIFVSLPSTCFLPTFSSLDERLSV
jgi:hypothetical protein